MLILRSEQISELARSHWLDFLDRVCIHLRECFPRSVEKTNDIELHNIITQECARARSIGLQCERDLVLYIDTGALLGWGWQEDPNLFWVKGLHEDDLPANARAEAFWNNARNEVKRYSN